MAGCPDGAWCSKWHLATEAFWALMHINKIVVWRYPDTYETLFYNMIWDFITCVESDIYEWQPIIYCVENFCVISDEIEICLILHSALRFMQNMLIFVNEFVKRSFICAGTDTLDSILCNCNRPLNNIAHSLSIRRQTTTKASSS